MVRWATPSFSARRLTAAASRRASGRRPWSIVTAQSLGAGLRRLRERAARNISAVESGPPETARTRAGSAARSANISSASASLRATSFRVLSDSAVVSLILRMILSEKSAIFRDHARPSAVDTLLFPLDRLLDARRGAGIFAHDLSEGRAGEFFLVEG